MSENKNFQNASGYFKKNKDLAAVFFTSDGQAFFNENYAANHAKKLGPGKDEVETISRESTQLAEVAVAPETKSKEDNTDDNGEK